MPPLSANSPRDGSCQGGASLSVPKVPATRRIRCLPLAGMRLLIRLVRRFGLSPNSRGRRRPTVAMPASSGPRVRTPAAYYRRRNRGNLALQCVARSVSWPLLRQPPDDPALDTIAGQFDVIRRYDGVNTPVQITGGEPTIRDDLPAIVALGRPRPVPAA